MSVAVSICGWASSADLVGVVALGSSGGSSETYSSRRYGVLTPEAGVSSSEWKLYYTSEDTHGTVNFGSGVLDIRLRTFVEAARAFA